MNLTETGEIKIILLTIEPQELNSYFSQLAATFFHMEMQRKFIVTFDNFSNSHYNVVKKKYFLRGSGKSTKNELDTC